MRSFFKKSVIVYCTALLFFLPHAFAQDSCYNCNIDSIGRSFNTAKTDAEKVRILTLLIDLRVLLTNANHVVQNTLADDSTMNNLNLLIKLSASEKVKDIEAYKILSEAFAFFKKKDYLGGQNSLKKAITLFDASHKKIPHLLMFTRLSFNLADNQEDRLKYFTEKLNYYLANGPAENVPACYHGIGGYYLYKADYNLAISNYLKAAAGFKSYDGRNYRNDLGVVADAYVTWGNYEKATEYYNKVIPLNKIAKDSFALAFLYIGNSTMNRSLGKYAQAVLASDTSILFNNNRFPINIAEAYMEKAFALISMNQLNDVLTDINYAKKVADSIQAKIFSADGPLEIDYGYYQYYSALKEYDKAGKYLDNAYEKSIDVKSNELQLKYLRELSLFYGQQHNPSLALLYTKKFFDLTDELNKEHSSFKIAQYENEEKEIQQNDSIYVLKQQSAIQAATIKKNNTILWGSLIAIILISVSLFFVYRQYRMNKKTLSSLRKTQRQLITAEKMASLGELTAGIAHEIQNPLNFVNNFSEVNQELIEELKSEKAKVKSERDEQLEIDILNDITANEEKINHHGKRADAIVKGMLQHSRSSSGVKEPTNINALADEYLRLAYHGLRAKDKSFNADFKTDFDETIGKINIVPQDIGRVLLNLYNNAFYAVNEKKKTADGNYQPIVSVQTKKLNDKIELTVKDNGKGIPQNIIDKIFQPFFTTKPTGEGTGLGLSLSYDIVKAHGGEIKVETKEGEGGEFIIYL